MPEPVDHIEGYIRTAEADSELRAPRLGLSLSQRKLLTLVEEGRSVAEMSAALHSDEARVRRDLSRLVELRLLRAPNAVVAGKPAAPTASRARPNGLVAPVAANSTTRLAHALPATRMAAAPRRRGAGIAAVALAGVAVAVVMAWPLRDRAAPESPTQMAAASSANAQPISAPVDARIGSIRPAAAAPEPVPGAAAQRAALVPTGMRVDARRGSISESGRASVPAAAPAQATTPPPALASRAATAVHQHPAPATALGVESSSSASPGAAVSPPPATAPSASVQAPHADDNTIAGTLPERPPIAPPVVVPAPLAPAASSPDAANRAEAPTLIATAPRTSLAALPRPKLTPIAREEPEFPRDALLENITSGRVRARLTIEKDGHVSSVQIVQAEPRRVFGRAVNRALSRWRFETAGEVRTTEVEVDFKAN